jgi:hypothetical protein
LAVRWADWPKKEIVHFGKSIVGICCCVSGSARKKELLFWKETGGCAGFIGNQDRSYNLNKLKWRRGCSCSGAIKQVQWVKNNAGKNGGCAGLYKLVYDQDFGQEISHTVQNHIRPLPTASG